MADYKIITLTGPDRVGKETQSKLLQRALQPSRLLSFPDYTHWSGAALRAIYTRGCAVVSYDWGEYSIDTEQFDPYIVQYLQEINRRAHQERIRKGLKTHHWVMDRYDIDSWVYGLAQGMPLHLLQQITRENLESDLVIVLDGKGYPRPGDPEDRNEQNKELQQRVREGYRAFAALYPERIVRINLEAYDGMHSMLDIFQVHDRICEIVEERLQLTVDSLTVSEIRALRCK